METPTCAGGKQKYMTLSRTLKVPALETLCYIIYLAYSKTSESNTSSSISRFKFLLLVAGFRTVCPVGKKLCTLLQTVMQNNCDVRISAKYLFINVLMNNF